MVVFIHNLKDDVLQISDWNLSVPPRSCVVLDIPKETDIRNSFLYKQLTSIDPILIYGTDFRFSLTDNLDESEAFLTKEEAIAFLNNPNFEDVFSGKKFDNFKIAFFSSNFKEETDDCVDDSVSMKNQNTTECFCNKPNPNNFLNFDRLTSLDVQYSDGYFFYKKSECSLRRLRSL